MIVAFVLFFLAGLGFGYAAASRWKWLPIGFPLVLALVTVLRDGGDGVLLVRLVIALVVTAIGIIAGTVLAPEEQPRRAEPGWR
jgi:hypothetical protein